MGSIEVFLLHVIYCISGRQAVFTIMNNAIQREVEKNVLIASNGILMARSDLKVECEKKKKNGNNLQNGMIAVYLRLELSMTI